MTDRAGEVADRAGGTTTAGAARRIAAEAVREYTAGLSGYGGAFLTGSVNGLADDDPLPPTSDVDVTVVVDRPGAKPGKVHRDGVLVELTPLARSDLSDPAVVARTFWLAPSFTGHSVLDDPTGDLTTLERAVAPGFVSADAVLARVADVADRVEQLDRLDLEQTWARIVTATIFPSSLPAVMIAVAARRLPTVRRRYPVAREVLDAAGELDAYEPLLELLGCARVDASTVSHHLDSLEAVFDETAQVARSVFPFSSDLSARARPVAIDASRRLVGAGSHREAVFWIVATFARCQQVLEVDVPSRAEETEPAFRAAVSDLIGLTATADVVARQAQVRAALPGLNDRCRALAHAPA